MTSEKSKTKQKRSTDLQSLKKQVAGLEEAFAEEKRKKEYLENLIENSPDCIVHTDAAGKIVYVNRAYLEKTGFSQKEIIGKTSRALFPHYLCRSFASSDPDPSC